MKLEFDLEKIKLTEFGVGLDDGDSTFVFVPVDGGVQSALGEMVETTWDSMRQDAEQPRQYEPSEKYSSNKTLYVPADDQMAQSLLNLHKAKNLPVQTGVLDNPGAISCYFVRLTDNRGRRLTGLRRATQFKGVLSKRNRLIRLDTDTLKLVKDNVFKLDNDFDLLIDSKHLFIWRPIAFESMGKLKQAILDAVPTNVTEIKNAIPFVDFGNIERYASEHPRAARYVASIRKQNLTVVDRSRLEELCRTTGVEIRDEAGQMTVAEGHVMGFLEVLDRRRFVDELDPQNPEPYRAASRHKIEKQQGRETN